MRDKMKEIDRNDLKNSNWFTISDVHVKKNGYLNPVLVTFQNGEVNAEHSNELKVTLTPGESGRTQIEVESSSGHLFKQVNYLDAPATRQFIAICNRKTNKARIVEVDSALLINSSLVPSEVVSDSVEPLDYNKSISNLNKTFGGKKLVNRLQQREKLNINSMLVGDNIKGVVEDIKNEKEETLSSNAVESESIIELLPPCNRNAQKVSEVYVLTEILNEEELEALKKEVKNLDLKKKLTDSDQYSSFFKVCYDEIKNSGENFTDSLTGILFVETLIKFLKKPVRQLSSKQAVFCSFSSVIHSKLLKEFCIKSGSSITRPFTMRDKIICYIIAVSLISCNFKINLKVLADVTSIHLNRLSRLARVVGAVPISKEGIMYHLKLPLPALPKSSIAKIKRK